MLRVSARQFCGVQAAASPDEKEAFGLSNSALKKSDVQRLTEPRSAAAPATYLKSRRNALSIQKLPTAE